LGDQLERILIQKAVVLTWSFMPGLYPLPLGLDVVKEVAMSLAG
jgi:hypothetical protein